MINAQADVRTANASRYLQQLCKHWSHKFVVRFDEQTGDIGFSETRTVHLVSHPDRLSIRLTDVNEDALAELGRIVADHIERFAFRETLEFDWVRQN